MVPSDLLPARSTLHLEATLGVGLAPFEGDVFHEADLFLPNLKLELGVGWQVLDREVAVFVA